MSAVDREYPRYAHEAEVRARLGGRELVGRTSNLSRGGLCASLSGELPARATVEVEVALVFEAGGTSEALSLPARVVWCTHVDEGFQGGVAVLPLDAEQAQYLEMFLRMLDDEPATSKGPGKAGPRVIDDLFRG